METFKLPNAGSGGAALTEETTAAVSSALDQALALNNWALPTPATHVILTQLRRNNVSGGQTI